MARFDGMTAVAAAVGLTVTDDGTYYVFITNGGDRLFKVRKSDGQLLIEGGLDTDQTI